MRIHTSQRWWPSVRGVMTALRNIQSFAVARSTYVPPQLPRASIKDIVVGHLSNATPAGYIYDATERASSREWSRMVVASTKLTDTTQTTFSTLSHVCLHPQFLGPERATFQHIYSGQSLFARLPAHCVKSLGQHVHHNTSYGHSAKRL